MSTIEIVVGVVLLVVLAYVIYRGKRREDANPASPYKPPSQKITTDDEPRGPGGVQR